MVIHAVIQFCYIPTGGSLSSREHLLQSSLDQAKLASARDHMSGGGTVGTGGAREGGRGGGNVTNSPHSRRSTRSHMSFGLQSGSPRGGGGGGEGGEGDEVGGDDDQDNEDDINGRGGWFCVVVGGQVRESSRPVAGGSDGDAGAGGSGNGGGRGGNTDARAGENGRGERDGELFHLGDAFLQTSTRDSARRDDAGRRGGPKGGKDGGRDLCSKVADIVATKGATVLAVVPRREYTKLLAPLLKQMTTR